MDHEGLAVVLKQTADQVRLPDLALAEGGNTGIVLCGFGYLAKGATALHQLLELLVIILRAIVLDPGQCLVDALYLVVQNVFYHNTVPD